MPEPVVEGHRPPNADPKRWIGLEIGGRYEVRSLIASGGMGSVYLAEQKPLGRRVALKVLHPHGVADAEAEERFRREAYLTSMLAHPHVVTVYDYGALEDGAYYLVMEYVDGPPLSKLIRARGRLSIADTAYIGVQLCGALSAAHARGLVHRDVKPGNVLLHAQTSNDPLFAKLVDFGLVKTYLPSNEDAQNTGEITAPGVILGSPNYMAPEQVISSARIGPEADVYSLGATLFYALSGRPPFKRKTSVETVIAQVQEPPRRLREIIPETEVDEAFEVVLMRCLEKAPKDRYPSVEELADELIKHIDPDTKRGTSSLRIVPMSSRPLALREPSTPRPAADGDTLSFDDSRAHEGSPSNPRHLAPIVTQAAGTSESSVDHRPRSARGVPLYVSLAALLIAAAGAAPWVILGISRLYNANVADTAHPSGQSDQLEAEPKLTSGEASLDAGSPDGFAPKSATPTPTVSTEAPERPPKKKPNRRRRKNRTKAPTTHAPSGGPDAGSRQAPALPTDIIDPWANE